MIVKSPILPKRVRKVPKSFNWIDHRLVSEKYIDRCSHAASALYLFLICVSDEQGLSYYGDKSIMEKLSMKLSVLNTARTELVRAGLLAWERPLYQVLDLAPSKPVCRGGEAMSLKAIFRKAMEEDA